jgi:hypothetical protein
MAATYFAGKYFMAAQVYFEVNPYGVKTAVERPL